MQRGDNSYGLDEHHRAEARYWTKRLLRISDVRHVQDLCTGVPAERSGPAASGVRVAVVNIQAPGLANGGILLSLRASQGLVEGDDARFGNAALAVFEQPESVYSAPASNESLLIQRLGETTEPTDVGRWPAVQRIWTNSKVTKPVRSDSYEKVSASALHTRFGTVEVVRAVVEPTELHDNSALQETEKSEKVDQTRFDVVPMSGVTAYGMQISRGVGLRDVLRDRTRSFPQVSLEELHTSSISRPGIVQSLVDRAVQLAKQAAQCQREMSSIIFISLDWLPKD
jgi:hypothetical protein